MLAKLTCRGRTFEKAVEPGAAGGRRVPDPRRLHQHPVPAGGARRPRLPRPAGSPRRFIETHPQLLTARGQRRPRHQAADLPRRRHRQPAARRGAGDPRPGHQAARRRPRRARARRHPAAAARARPGGVRAPAARAERRRGHRHHLPRRPPVAARDPGAHPRPARRRRPRRPDDARSCGRSRPGAARRTTWRCASCPRTRGSGWPRCARRCRTSACRCCCAAATRSATRRTPPRSPTPSSRRRRRPASTSSGSSTRSTTSSRCGRRSRRCARPAPRSPRSRSATPATSPTRARRSTRSTTTCGWPSGSSTPARTCWRSRTWPGCCARRPRARWSPRCASGSTCPCTCTPTTPRAASSRTLLAAIDAGVDAVDAATRLDGRHDLAAVALRAGRGDRPPDRETGLSLAAVCELEPYWEATRRVYAPFESGLPAPTGRVYRHEIPGGQLSNLRQQAIALGLGEKFEQIEDMYAAANDILGNIVKVTPSSKVVGDLALHLVAVGADPAEFAENPGKFDIPDSVIGFLYGELGDPPGGWPEPFRTKALEGRSRKPPAERAHRRAARGAGRAAAADPPRDAQRAAVPRPDQGVRRGPRDVRRRVGAADPSTTSTGCAAARSTRSSSRRARR